MVVALHIILLYQLLLFIMQKYQLWRACNVLLLLFVGILVICISFTMQMMKGLIILQAKMTLL